MSGAEVVSLVMAGAALLGVAVTILKLRGERKNTDADTRLKDAQAKAEEVGLLAPLRTEIDALREDLSEIRRERDLALITMRAEQATKEAAWEAKCADLLVKLASANRRTDLLLSRVRKLETKLVELGHDPEEV